MNKNRKKNTVTESAAKAKLKGFLDMIAPSVIQFNTDHYICGNTYCSVWALREYPTATDYIVFWNSGEQSTQIVTYLPNGTTYS